MRNTEKDSFYKELLQKAEKLKLQGKNREAVAILEKIIVEDPEAQEAYEELGDNFLTLRETEKAKKCLLHALKLNKNSANAKYLLGFLYSIEQKWVLSVEMLEESNKILPNNPEILRCLGWSLFNQGKRGQGIALLERSQTIKPNDPNILCDLGVCYMNSEDYEKAEGMFKKVITIAPHSEQAKECRSILNMLQKTQQ